MTDAEVQRALLTLGYGEAGPTRAASGVPVVNPVVRSFQEARGLLADGKAGPITAKALEVDLAARQPAGPATSAGVVPAAWMPACRMDGIVVHWTAGPHKATGLDRSHYHLIIEGDGTLVRGNLPISANAAPIRGAYAAHCLNANTGRIGVSLACMAGAVESPFKAGTAPMTRTQWDKLPLVLADLCRRYVIPVTPRAVLSHAEVQDTLGIAQRGKWDIARLAFDPSIKGAKACGDIFRARAADVLGTVALPVAA